MKSRERFYTNGHGVDDAAAKALFEEALIYATKLDNVDKAVFIAHGLQNDGWLRRVFGDEITKGLKSGVPISNSTNIIAIFESLKTYNHSGRDIVITLGLKSDEILKLEDEYEILAFFALPWLEDDIIKWSRITNAVCIETNLPAVAFPNPPCSVIKALEDLTKSINMSTGIHHPSDNDLAKTYLRALSHYEIELNEENIESYLIKELDWQKEYADDLLKIIQKINNGGTFQGGQKTGLKYHYERWRKECDEV